MATTLEREAVFDFYEAELADRGYTRDDKDLANIRTTIEHELRVWRKGDVVARVAFLRVGDVRVPAPPAGMPDASLFELAFIAKPPENFAPPS